ncbi:MAG TPA: lanthionine synthetase LanC family protein [Verrucomicrobiae bacterium]|nr:lanthionine synthetase LanC family protein [Verrucomicrobiae bacterium]
MLCIRSAEARDAALALGERLLEETALPDAVDPNLERFANRALNGPPGFALAFLALGTATGDSRFEAAMHGQLRRAAHAQDRPLPGLFNGISGLRGVAALAVAAEPRYRRLVERCDAYVEEIVAQRAPRRAALYGEFDLMFGWSGMRLARCVRGPSDDDALIELLAWVAGEDERWCCLHPLYPQDGPVNHLGMAHGIAGVLSALALTAGSPTASQEEIVRSCASRLAASRICGRDGTLSWPRTAQDGERDPCRSVWCVGAGGIAIALLQAAQRLRDAELERFAVLALERMAARPRDRWLMSQNGICHGTIGTALVFYVAARRTGREDFARLSQRLAALTIEELAANGGRVRTRGFDGAFYDAIGELNGIAGIVTGLLTIAGEFDPAWLHLHGMQP